MGNEVKCRARLGKQESEGKRCWRPAKYFFGAIFG